jgi:hypothetical protein
MSGKPKLAVALALTLIFCGAGPGLSDAQEPAPSGSTSIEDDYAALGKALRARDGDAAAALVTAGTLAEYETCRKLALDSEGADFADMNQLSVALVFQLRYLLERERLVQMTGRDVFAWGVKDGMVKLEVLDSVAIDKVQRDGRTAYATMAKDGQVAADVLFTFRNEEGRWKLDLSEIMNKVGKQLDAARERAGKTKVEMAVSLLEHTYGESIPPAILNGPLK